MPSPPWTNAWNEASPADSDLANTLGNVSRTLKLDVRQRMAYQHVWNKDVNTDGAHINIILSDADTLANKEILRAFGYSLTGSGNNCAINIQGTWNTSATTTAIFLNITDTSSPAGCFLMDLQVGLASKFSVKKNGDVSIAGALSVGGGGVNFLGAAVVYQSNTAGVALSGSYQDVGPSAVITPGTATDKVLVRGSFNVEIGCNVISSTVFLHVQLKRGSTVVAQWQECSSTQSSPSFSGSVLGAQHCFEYLDSPASGSAQTYQFQAKFTSLGGGGFGIVNPDSLGISSVSLMCLR